MQEESRRKQKNRSVEKVRGIPSFKDFVRQLPVGLPENIMSLIRKLPAINGRFNEHLETVTLYRPALGTSFEACWVELLDFIKKLVVQISFITKGTTDD